MLWLLVAVRVVANPLSNVFQKHLTGRSADPLFRANAVRTPEGHLSFVYKAAAEIGELGDNTAAMRAARASVVFSCSKPITFTYA